MRTKACAILIAFWLTCNLFASAQTSQIVISSRWFHPRDSSDPESTLAVIDSIKPGRIDWIYYENDNILEEYRSRGLEFSLAINPQIADSSGFTTKKHRILDYKGETFVAPWMRKWKNKNPYWGCVNNPGFYSLFLERTLFLASKGPYAIMVDDALFNVQLKGRGGCFCQFCTNKFLSLFQLNSTVIDHLTKAVRKNSKDRTSTERSLVKRYEDFQFSSVVTFLSKWKKDVREHNPRMRFLTNNYNGSWNEIYKVFDGGIAELDSSKVTDETLDLLYATADSMGKSQLFSIATTSQKTHSRLVKYNLKHQRSLLLPWDIFIPGEPKRYYMGVSEMKSMVTQ